MKWLDDTNARVMVDGVLEVCVIFLRLGLCWRHWETRNLPSLLMFLLWRRGNSVVMAGSLLSNSPTNVLYGNSKMKSMKANSPTSSCGLKRGRKRKSNLISGTARTGAEVDPKSE